MSETSHEVSADTLNADTLKAVAHLGYLTELRRCTGRAYIAEIVNAAIQRSGFGAVMEWTDREWDAVYRIARNCRLVEERMMRDTYTFITPRDELEKDESISRGVADENGRRQNECP